MSLIRTFHFSEGTSNKFWSIAVEGNGFAVNFGRIGTIGQRQDKIFASEQAAQAAADKLIAEKVAKGYVEQSAGATKPLSAVARAAAPRSQAVQEAPARNPETAAAVPAAQPEPAAVPGVRRINLDADDWRYATWSTIAAPPAGPVRAFDQAACCAVVARIRPGGYGWDWHLERLQIPARITTQEAVFWMFVLDQMGGEITPAALADRLAGKTIPATLPFDEIQRMVIKNCQRHGPFVVIPLRHLVTPQQFVELCLLPGEQVYSWAPLSFAIPGSIHAWLVPYLSAQERESFQSALRPHVLAAARNAAEERYEADRRLFVLAGRLGLHRELASVVQAMSPIPAESGHGMRKYIDIVLGLGSAAEILREAKRLKIHPTSEEQARAWLATTGFAGLETLATAVLAQTDKEQAAELARALALVDAPEVAPYMLRIREQSRAPAIGRDWLERHQATAIAGLAPLLGGSGPLAQSALEWLRLLKRQGSADAIAAALPVLPTDAALKLRDLVIDHQAIELTPFPAGEPAWFPAGAPSGKLPGWASPASLPPLVCGRFRLQDAQVAAVLAALKDPRTGTALIARVRQHVDAASADAFAWQLFQMWMGDGAPSKDKWAMLAMGQLGGDGCVMRLTPLVRAWPGESQHARAVTGLEILRQIGSDIALMQLNGVAQKLPFKGLKTKATEFMEAIARDKGLSRAELEDRIVPDCGLDERGQRVFSFGPRQFAFVLGPELKPVLRDAVGKLIATLPKPNAKDDATAAVAATEAWKIMKKQIADTAKLQAQRLEQAMVTGRRWKPGDFQSLVIAHPLMIHLARLLVWAGYGADGRRSVLFRITDERETVDHQDHPVDIGALSQVGVVHPLHLSGPERGTWGQVVSDYGIIPPFPQLGRPVHTPDEAEISANAFLRCKGMRLPAPTLVFGLEKLGWIRGAALDAGGFYEHVKAYPAAGCTAVITYDGCVSMGYIDPNETLAVTECFLVPGVYSAASYPEHDNRQALSGADPVVLSEVLADILALAAKAT